jgi:uncharacterized repeat protein (TIGR03803 family)
MYLSETNSRTKSHLNISNVEPRFGATKLAAGAPHIRAFCECAGLCAIRSILILAVLSALLLIAALPAQAKVKETMLYDFCSIQGDNSCYDGTWPAAGLTSDGAGNFYGMTEEGGAFGYGEVFELSPNGSGGWNETVLYSFTGGADGGFTYYSDVIFDSVGNLYGTTTTGGANGLGVVFELSPVGASWTETVLYSFAGGADGAYPFVGVRMDPAGNLYGTTFGSNFGTPTVFELSPSGGGWTKQVIYSVATSQYAALKMDAAGNIFGVGYSTAFELSPNGNGGWNPTVIHTFTGSPKDGSDPNGTPVLDQAGNLYGTTSEGGTDDEGTVYKLSPGRKGKWTERILHSFKGETKDGGYPFGGIVFDAAGNMYGTTSEGGNYGNQGTVFKLVAPVGRGSYREKVLWNFTQTDGGYPYCSLILDSAGNLYGTTYYGGATGSGVVFEVTP